MKKIFLITGFLFSIFSAHAQTIVASGPTTFCSGQSVTLSVSGATGNPTYQWTLGGSFIPGATSISLVVTASGTYNVILNGTPLPPQNNVVVTVHPKPDVSISFTQSDPCARKNVYFNSTITGGTSPYTYNWNFDDPWSPNNSSNISNPFHAFFGPTGNVPPTYTFNVKLIVTDAKGCKDTATSTVTINKRPDATLGPIPYTIHDGNNYFVNCTPSQNADFTFSNLSSTQGPNPPNINVNYRIIWSIVPPPLPPIPDFNSTTFNSLLTQNFPIGTHHLDFIVTSQNGCLDTTRYYVFLGTQPFVSLVPKAGESLIKCVGDSIIFEVKNFSSNPPSTTYTFEVNDGSIPRIFNHPPQDTIIHIFNRTSCGTNSSLGGANYPNSFVATLKPKSPCNLINYNSGSGPIYVSRKPVAAISVSPKDTVCINNTVTLCSTGILGHDLPANSGCGNTKYIWSINPSPDSYSGSLGNDFGNNDPIYWNSGTSCLTSVVFSTPGIYTIKLKVGAKLQCGLDSVVRTICVNERPVAAFSVDKTSGCDTLIVTTTNNSSITSFCGQNSFKWSVTSVSTPGCRLSSVPIYINSTTDTSRNPKFQFNDPGIYTIGLYAIAPATACSSPLATQIITVKGKPIVTISSPPGICITSPLCATSSATCYINASTTYTWTSLIGTPTNSNLPNTCFLYSRSGPDTITLKVKNECGETLVSRPIIVYDSIIAKAGDDDTLCGNSVTMAANAAAPGTGSWTLVSTIPIGLPTPGFNPNSNSPIAIISPLSVGTYNYRWTITNNGFCKSSDDVIITKVAGPSPSNPGPDQSLCTPRDTIWLNATNPSLGSGVWKQSTANSPQLSITNPASNYTSVTAMPPLTVIPAGVYKFTWTNSFGDCTPSEGEMTVTIYDNPTPSYAGRDTTICDTSTTLAGNQLQSTETGLWELVRTIPPNLPVIGIPNTSYNANVSGLQGGIYEFRWTISNGPCPPSSDTVRITVTEQPTVAYAGRDTTICAVDSALLNGSPNIVGTGIWTQTGGPQATISQPNSPNTSVRDLQRDSIYYFTWTISNGVCPSSFDTVRIAISDTAITSNPGRDTTICATSYTLGGNLPLGTETGLWTLVSTNPPNLPVTGLPNNLPNAFVSGLTSGIYKFRWTITHGACISDSIVTITVVTAPTEANANLDQRHCSVDTTWLNGNDPVVGTGQWTQHSLNPPGANILSPTSNNTKVAGLNPGDYKFIWTISINDCTPSRDTIAVKIDAKPTVSNAGRDTILCASTYRMSANPALTGSGYWYLISNTSSGSPSFNPIDPTTTVTGLQPGTYKFRWSISNGICDTSHSDVQIKVDAAPSFPDAGTNQVLCGARMTQLTGNASTPFIGNILWEQTIWPIGFLAAISPSNTLNTTVSDLVTGLYTFRLTISNGVCPSNTSSVVVTVTENPTLNITNYHRICRGQTVQLNAEGSATNYQWAPLNGLSCNNCPNPFASPQISTTYVVTATNSYGCTKSESVEIEVIQPFRITTSASDTICFGQSTTLTASGASNYSWTPPGSLDCPTCANPVASPAITTTYTVVGKDDSNCFTDTGYVRVAVGNKLTISLGPDQTVATGTLLSLNPAITNGPVKNYKWTPSTNLSFDNSPVPVATVKNDICYILDAESIYGCKATDTLCIKVFCNNSQLFIPNTFTPDGDGINDILRVRGTGIRQVKQFLVFNRWGEIVFEKSNFPPNDSNFGWDGKIKGKGSIATPDVYVYIAEVVCENGAIYKYQGNVTLIR